MTRRRIEQLFEKRENQFKRNTDQIFEYMSDVLEGVVHYFSLKDEISQGQMTWEKVTLQDDIVLLICIIKYPPGAEFTTSEGEVMVVSEQTQDYFTRILRLGLPIDLVAERSKEKTIEFLEDLEEKERQMQFSELPPDANPTDFNLDDLTEEQKQAMLMVDGKVH